MKTKLLLTASLLVFITLLTGCAKLGDYNVSIGGEVIEEDDKIVVEGKSNLLPGSKIVGEVIVSEDEVFADTVELVDEDGEFKMEFDHHQYGEAEVRVTFEFANSQEEEIGEHYGEGGEKLEGPFVYLREHWGATEKKAVANVKLNPEEDVTTHTFVEPVWNERPEDYGDPRVWIEVDEITTDEYKDYFYLRGRTNLLEGSRIKGSFDYSSEDTSVKPDGTFELKIKYKYEEDTPFIVQFHPNSQWDSIKEVYGKNGEKLVGTNVETSGNNQYVEITADYTY